VDKSAQDALNAKVQAASIKIDSLLAGMTDAHARVAAGLQGSLGSVQSHA
jgi:hypothetical protein